MFGLAPIPWLAMANPGSAEEGLKRRVTQLDIIHVPSAVFNTQNTFRPRRVLLRPAPPLLIPRGEKDVERHGQEEIEDQDRERRIDHCFGGRPSHSDRALAAR